MCQSEGIFKQCIALTLVVVGFIFSITSMKHLRYSRTDELKSCRIGLSSWHPASKRGSSISGRFSISLIMSCSGSDYESIKERDYDDFNGHRYCVASESSVGDEQLTREWDQIPYAKYLRAYNSGKTKVATFIKNFILADYFLGKIFPELRKRLVFAGK